MPFRYERLAAPRYLVGGGDQAHNASFAGISQFGPYSSGTCPREPRVLFVFPEEFRQGANQLFLALKNGMGSFKGTEALFGFSLHPGNVARVQPFSLGTTAPETASRYFRAVEAELLGTADYDCALVLQPKTSRRVDENPYLAARFPLLRAGIPVQAVTTEIIQNPEALKWSVGNIALGMFAKMGGQPWAIQTELKEDVLVVGVNRVIIPGSRRGRNDRYYGFATIFANNGLYRGTRLFPTAVGFEEYLVALRGALEKALSEWREQVGRPVNLVFHVQKHTSRKEVSCLQSIMQQNPDLVRSFVILRFSYASHMMLRDSRDRQAIPPARTLLYLDPRRVLLQISGKGPQVGKGVTEPWQIEQLEASPGAPPLRVLCTNVVALAAMNWRGFNADAKPVSIQYPRLMADLIARFDHAGFDVSELEGLSILNRTWFL